MEALGIFGIGFTIGGLLFDWVKGKEIKKLEKELDELGRKSGQMEIELNELKRA